MTSYSTLAKLITHRQCAPRADQGDLESFQSVYEEWLQELDDLIGEMSRSLSDS